MGSRIKIFLPYLILVVAGIIIVFVIPELFHTSTGCIIQKTTGFYCAGCGLSRSIHALLKGHIARSIHQNILLLTAFPAAGLWLAWRFFKIRKGRSTDLNDTAVIIFFFVIVAVFTVLRNLPARCFDFLRPI